MDYNELAIQTFETICNLQTAEYNANKNPRAIELTVQKGKIEVSSTQTYGPSPCAMVCINCHNLASNPNRVEFIIKDSNEISRCSAHVGQCVKSLIDKLIDSNFVLLDIVPSYKKYAILHLDHKYLGAFYNCTTLDGEIISIDENLYRLGSLTQPTTKHGLSYRLGSGHRVFHYDGTLLTPDMYETFQDKIAIRTLDRDTLDYQHIPDSSEVYTANNLWKRAYRKMCERCASLEEFTQGLIKTFLPDFRVPDGVYTSDRITVERLREIIDEQLDIEYDMRGEQG